MPKEWECRTSLAMEKSELLKRLEQVEEQVWHDMDLIARQRKILAELDEGVDIDAIKIMLVEMENLLDINLQEREKLRAELARLDGS
jgi:hypothetical protein